MHFALLALAVLAAAAQLAFLAEIAAGSRKLRFLRDVPPLSPDDMPAISVIVAARNEERGVRAGVGSLLKLDSVAEVIAVDDRSSDATGAILDDMARADPRLKVVHLTELPAGWLGKNHALWRGAEESTGELLLFTDADVVMAPSTLLRAAGYMRAEGVAMMTVAPHVDMPGVLLKVFSIAFGIFFVIYARPWRALKRGSAAHVGVGAFNLVRADAYRAAGTHQAIAMRPDDDMKLAKLIKKAGFAQGFAMAADFVSVEWYASVRETVEGLKKNAFSALDYSLPGVVFATAMHFLVFTWPWIAVFLSDGPARWLYAVAVAVMALTFAGSARQQKVPAWYAPLFPAACVMFVYVIWNATLYTLRTGGIEWRGTRYPLAELKANRI
jgi:cellulose synthase/poly-beta-1,6-N-acetylglucosamine synthase-like glycosyltransferase